MTTPLRARPLLALGAFLAPLALAPAAARAQPARPAVLACLLRTPRDSSVVTDTLFLTLSRPRRPDLADRRRPLTPARAATLLGAIVARLRVPTPLPLPGTTWTFARGATMGWIRAATEVDIEVALDDRARLAAPPVVDAPDGDALAAALVAAVNTADADAAFPPRADSARAERVRLRAGLARVDSSSVPLTVVRQAAYALAADAIVSPRFAGARPAPTYPPSLLSAEVTGTVTAAWRVDTLGRAVPASFEIIGSAHPLFDEAVLAAVRRVPFEPARVGGCLREMSVREAFTFRIE
jgi:TonB family protein